MMHEIVVKVDSDTIKIWKASIALEAILNRLI